MRLPILIEKTPLEGLTLNVGYTGSPLREKAAESLNFPQFCTETQVLLQFAGHGD